MIFVFLISNQTIFYELSVNLLAGICIFFIQVQAHFSQNYKQKSKLLYFRGLGFTTNNIYKKIIFFRIFLSCFFSSYSSNTKDILSPSHFQIDCLPDSLLILRNVKDQTFLSSFHSGDVYLIDIHSRPSSQVLFCRHGHLRLFYIKNKFMCTLFR